MRNAKMLLWIALSILSAFFLMVLAQWLPLGYSIFYNSLLYVVLFFLHGYAFGLTKGMIGALSVVLCWVILLIPENHYSMTHFFQNGLMITACATGALLKVKKYRLLLGLLGVMLGLLGISHHYHSTPRYQTEKQEVNIEIIHSAGSELIGHYGQPLTLTTDTVYLINFSFRNCAPCRRKKKSLEIIADRLKNEPFKIVEIHAFEAKQIFDSDYFFDYAEAYHDTENKLSKQLNVLGAPTEFILDKNGNFIRRFDGFEPGVASNYEKTTCSLIKHLMHEN